MPLVFVTRLGLPEHRGRLCLSFTVCTAAALNRLRGITRNGLTSSTEPDMVWPVR
jgi:hypothetical protein